MRMMQFQGANNSQIWLDLDHIIAVSAVPADKSTAVYMVNSGEPFWVTMPVDDVARLVRGDRQIPDYSNF